MHKCLVIGHPNEMNTLKYVHMTEHGPYPSQQFNLMYGIVPLGVVEPI